MQQWDRGGGGGLLRLALSASLLTSSLCRKGVDGGSVYAVIANELGNIKNSFRKEYIE